MRDSDLATLRIPRAQRDRAREILAIADDVCRSHLDVEYAHCSRELIGQLARRRPSPLARGAARIWAAGVIYAIGQVNFLFDPSQQPHLSADQLAELLGVVKTTMANKAALINKALDIGVLEPDLTTTAMLEQHPLAWIVEVDTGLTVAELVRAYEGDEFDEADPAVTELVGLLRIGKSGDRAA